MSDIDLRLVARISAAVAALPEAEQAVFLLHAIDEHAYPAIADRLGIDLAEVERLLASALILLAGHLANAAAGEGPPGNDV